MGLCGTNGSYDAFTDSCQNCRFAGAAHQAFQIRSYGYSCFYKKFNTILCHSRYIGGFDDLGIYAHFYSFQDVTACQVDSRRLFKRKLYARPFRCNQCINHIVHVAACQIMGFQLVYPQIHACLSGLNQRKHDTGRNHTPQLHTDKVENADFYVSSQ